MFDDKNQTGGRDRSQVAAGQDYEVQYFAEQNGITVEPVRELIETHGNDRDKLEEAARRLNA